VLGGVWPRNAPTCPRSSSRTGISRSRPRRNGATGPDKFRTGGIAHKIIYFYVVDESKRLLGVLPTRLLLTAALDTRIEDIYVRRIFSLPASATLREAQEAFSRHQFLAFPIVDESHRLLGVIDVQTFAGELEDVHQRTSFDDIYELLGLQAGLREEASPVLSFRMRFPWLLSTIAAGSIGAVLTSFFEATLREQIVLAFFLTMTLGLNEGVCMQSATLAIQRLHAGNPDLRRFARSLGREARVAALLGLACALIVGVLALAWRRDLPSALVIGLSLLATITVSCLWGMAIPPLLRTLQRDPKVAAAPIALALSDVSTLVIYFETARRLLPPG
jgi:magnesium transporter